MACTAGVRTNITGLTAVMVPSTSIKRIKITAQWSGEHSINPHNAVYGLRRNGVDIGNPPAAGIRPVGISVTFIGFGGGVEDLGTQESTAFTYIDSPASTAGQIYTMTILCADTKTLYINRTVGDTDANNRERLTSHITLEEID